MAAEQSPDFLVVGAGVAGLRAAIELAASGTVLVLAKDSLRESSSEYAQGGIAAALSDDDDIELHEQDTIVARDGTELAFAREGAHSRSRVLHSYGDSTGREISRALYARASSLTNVEFHT